MDGGLLQSVFIFLAFICFIVPVSKWAGLGSVIGYLIAGVLIGPFALGFITDPTTILHFSEFGVVMMLFIIGLELQPRELWKLKGQLLGLGLTQVLVTTTIIAVVGIVAGRYWGEGVVIGMALALSSTAIAIQIMQDRGMMSTPVGKAGFSILIFQDVAVIAMIALLPALAMHGVGDAQMLEPVLDAGHTGAQSHGPDHSPGKPGPSGWLLAVSIFGCFAGMIIVGRVLLRPLFRFIARMGVRETFTALALLLVVGSALLMQWLGLSAALGAFIAGVVLADSDYRHQLERDIEPFKALLLGLFFMSVGMSIDFGTLMANPTSIAMMVIGLFAVKFAVIFCVAKVAKMETVSASLLAILLSQGGEFAFVLFQFALTENAISVPVATKLNAVVALSMASTPLLLLAYDKIVARKINLPIKTGESPQDEGFKVLVLGFGRVGQMAARLVNTQNIETTLIDYDGDHIEFAGQFGSKVYYGDAGDMDLLRTAGAANMDVIIVAIDNMDLTTKIVHEIKQQFPNAKVLARSRNRRHSIDLMGEGADHVERETIRGGLALGGKALEYLGFDKAHADTLTRAFLKHDNEMVQALFEVGDDMDSMIAHSNKAREYIKDALQGDAETWKKRDLEQKS